MTIRREGISVVVCTYRGAEYLPETLATLFATAREAHGYCEILLVDNASDDDTAKIIAEAAQRAPVPFVALRETRLGLSHARNCGVAHARGHIIAFTDDDVSVPVNWIPMLEQVFSDRDVTAAGGKILPGTGSGLPTWLTPDLHHHFALLDYGDLPQRMHSAAVWGANMAFRAECFDRHGRFDPALGRRGEKLYVGEETEFLARMINAGELVMYDPRLFVQHRLSPERLSKAWLCRRMFDLGELEQQTTAAYRGLFGVPLWALRDLLRKALALLNPADRNAMLRLRLRLNFCLGHAHAARRVGRSGWAGGPQ